MTTKVPPVPSLRDVPFKRANHKSSGKIHQVEAFIAISHSGTQEEFREAVNVTGGVTPNEAFTTARNAIRNRSRFRFVWDRRDR